MLARWTRETSVHFEMMDTYSTQAIPAKRQYRKLEEKRRIVEETLAEGASVSGIARAHGVNSNLVFNWRKLYRAGRLGTRRGVQLLPVTVTAESSSPERDGLYASESTRSLARGAMHIQLEAAQVRVEGNVDPRLLRVVLECLGR
jgi:transposase